MYIIKREDIPSIQSVIINDRVHDLGLLKDFKKHFLLKQYIPEQAHISISWVRLKKYQVLQTHQHPTTSMVIIAEGEVQTTGHLECIATVGDIVLIPPNVLHGFIGSGENGLWGISIQFEGNGLYEKPHQPRVVFKEET